MDKNEPLTVSTLKAWLERVLAEHGDLPVYSFAYNDPDERPMMPGRVEDAWEAFAAGESIIRPQRIVFDV